MKRARKNSKLSRAAKRFWRVLLVDVLSLAIAFPPAITFLPASQAHGQSFNIGYKKYVQGDFIGSENALKSALKRGPSTAEKARIYKYLGIVQYMQDKRSDAIRSFKAALALNPSSTIHQNEVLDESVIQAFNSLKKNSPKTASSHSAQTKAPNAQNAPAQTQQVSNSPAKHTLLKINCNVNGSVMIDGILAGSTNSSIEMDPGTTTIQITAAGYQTKALRVQLAKNQETTVTVSLTKLTKPKPNVAATNTQHHNNKAQKQQNGQPYLPPPGGSSSLFKDEDGSLKNQSYSGRDLASEYAIDAQTAPAAPQQQPMPQQQQPIPQQQQPRPPQQMPQQYQYQQGPSPYSLQQGGYLPPPQYPQQQAYQPYYGPYQQYPPYQQPYGYQPYAMPQPQYQQPYTPPQQVAPAYTPPTTTQPANEPPATDYYYDQPKETFLPTEQPKKTSVSKQKNTELAVNNPSKNTIDATKQHAKKKSSSSSDYDFYLIALLPFGAGQYMNGNYLLGFLFMGGELGALYWWYYNSSMATKAAQNAQDYYNDPNNTDDQKQQFSDETESYVNSRKQDEMIGLGAFFGLWAIGAFQAIYYRPNQKHKKTTVHHDKFLGMNEFSLDQYPTLEAEAEPDNLQTFQRPPIRLSLGLMLDTRGIDTRGNETPKPAPGIGFNMDL